MIESELWTVDCSRTVCAMAKICIIRLVAHSTSNTARPVRGNTLDSLHDLDFSFAIFLQRVRK